MGNNTHKGISRIDSDDKNMHGWFARVYLKSKVFSNRYFNDKKFGGKQKALQAAKEYREMTIKERNVQHPEAVNARRRVTSDSRNKTGIIGISRTKIKSKSGAISEFFQVTWRPRKNVVRTKSFSVKKYGEEGALNMAWEIRQKAEKQMYGDVQTPNFDIYKKNYTKKRQEKELPDFSGIF